jgi:hypothetical protein
MASTLRFLKWVVPGFMFLWKPFYSLIKYGGDWDYFGKELWPAMVLVVNWMDAHWVGTWGFRFWVLLSWSCSMQRVWGG